MFINYVLFCETGSDKFACANMECGEVQWKLLSASVSGKYLSKR